MLNKNSRLLVSARFITRFGDQIDGLAFAWIMYALTKSPMMMGLVMALNAMPSILFGYFTGGLIDKFSKKNLIIFSGLGRMGLVGILLAMYVAKVLTPVHLCIFSFLVSTFELFEYPSVSSLIPEIVEEEQTMTVISSLKTLATVANVTGAAAAAFIVSMFGIPWMIVVDLLTFALSSLLVVFIRVPQKQVTCTDSGAVVDNVPEKTMKSLES